MNDKFRKPCCPSPTRDDYMNKDKLGYNNVNFTETLTRLIDGKFSDINDTNNEILGDIKAVLSYINNGSPIKPSPTPTPTPTPEVKYTVSFNGNGATSGYVPNAVSLTAGEYDINTIVTAYTLVKDGYTLYGWNTTASATTVLTKVTINGDTTLYAIWKQNETLPTPKFATPIISYSNNVLVWNTFTGIDDEGVYANVWFKTAVNGNWGLLTTYRIYEKTGDAKLGGITISDYLTTPGNYKIRINLLTNTNNYLGSDFSNELNYTVQPKPSVTTLSTPTISITEDNYVKLENVDVNATGYYIVMEGNLNSFTDNSTNIIPSKIYLPAVITSGGADTFVVKVKLTTTKSNYTESNYSNSITYSYSGVCAINIIGFNTEEDATGLGKDGDIEVLYTSYGTPKNFLMTESDENGKSFYADRFSNISIDFKKPATPIGTMFIKLESTNGTIDYTSATTDPKYGTTKTFEVTKNDTIKVQYHSNGTGTGD